ncbi:MAG: thioredoxin domain-containing protein [Chloroflexota bacterium]
MERGKIKMTNLVHITDNSFDAEVLKCDIPVLTCFLAGWSTPGQKMAAAAAELAAEYAGQLKTVGVDIETNPLVTSKYTVLNVPTLVLFKFGQEVQRMRGVVSKEELRAGIAPFLDE